MNIDFDAGRWEEVKENYGKWWEGKLERPLINMTLSNCKSPRKKSKHPYLHFTSFYDLSVSPGDVVDAWDYELSTKKFIGDGFPAIWPNFGPGVIAAFLGTNLSNGDNTVWFHPKKELSLDEIKFEFDSSGIWFNRVKDICRAATDRWQGNVQVGMTDLGGNLDIVSSFRPGENLLLDLYDNPRRVKELLWEAHDKWWAYFEDINSVLRPVNPGYTAWTPIFSEKPYYMLQCDFCYMIGPDMFDEFVKPELAATCKKLNNAFYHLDGIGELPHLDSLLSIKELKGVQWVPGDGKPDIRHWPEVYRKIHDAGKLIQIFGSMESLDVIADQIGTSEGIVLITGYDISQEADAVEFLKKHGAM